MDSAPNQSSPEQQAKKAEAEPLVSNFSEQLDGAFNLGALQDLSQTVEDKKRVVSSQNQELEALEAQIKATEARLKQAGAAPQATTGQQQPQQGTTKTSGN